MTLALAGDRKYQPESLLGNASGWDGLRIERRKIGAGLQNSVRLDCNEFAHIVTGRANVRRSADNQTQEWPALPGVGWLVPAGTNETLLEFDGPTECLIVFFPTIVLENSALAEYGIDPAKAALAYVGGFADPTLTQIGSAMLGLVGRQSTPIDRIFAQGLQAALTAHLLGHYSIDRWRPVGKAPLLDSTRLRRVLDYLEQNLSENISLDDLANQACLSPFHFSRLFHETTGMSPHRYVIERRIGAAREMLSGSRSPIAIVALEAGFGSQANFSRTFRKITGTTPRQYRELSARR